jgi:hypothetical protein
MHFAASKILQSGKRLITTARMCRSAGAPRIALASTDCSFIEIRDRSARLNPLLYGKPSAARRQADATARCLDHIISSHLHDVGTPIELLRLVF